MKILIITEKLNTACKLAAVGRNQLGDFILSNGKLLTDEYISNNEKEVNNLVNSLGKLENNKYVITYVAGHIVELYQAYDYDLKYKNWKNIPFGYIPEDFKFKIKKNSENMFIKIQKLMNNKNIKEIIVATDADREGSNIFACINKLVKCNDKPIKRLWTDAFNQIYIEKSFKNIKNIDYYSGIEKAGYYRMISDFILGALLTSKATICINNNSIVNIGRVQTAVLNEIVRIEKLIKNFSSKIYYEIIGKFYTEDGIEYYGIYDKKFDNLDEVKNIIENLNDKKAKIKSYKIVKEKTSCQNLFDQTNLAIEISNKYKLKPEDTLKASQSLYEKGFQTYPRTSSRYITNGDLKDFELMLKNINKIYPFSLDYKINKKIINNKKVESHSAIIPTSNIPKINTLNNNERVIYNEVSLRSIAINFPQAIDEKQNIETIIDNIIFKTTGKREIDKGWRKVYNLDIKDTYIDIDKKKVIKNYEIDYKEIKTQPPKRYTIAKILKFMESCGKNIDNDEIREIMKNKGIGTSSTRAEIIKKLINYNYIFTKGNTIYPTKKGNDLIEILPIDELKDAEFTGNLEYKLYQIEKQEIDENIYFDYIKNLYIDCCKKLENLNNNYVGKCPICNNNVIHKNSDKYNFYGCNNYTKGCNFTINSIYGVLPSKKDVIKLLSEKVTNEINGFKNETGNEFKAKLQLIDNKINLLKI
jgi:DNA topoisomerase-3